jgi:DNA repair protein RadC
MAAQPGALRRTAGVSDAVVAHMKGARALALRIMGTRPQTGSLLNNRRRLMQFFDTAFGFETRECLMVMYTDSACRMITYDLIRAGTVDHVPVYPREIVKRALENAASGLFLVHNHPSGDPTPSLEDLVLTRTIADACRLLDIALHDHLIVASGRRISFKDSNLL